VLTPATTDPAVARSWLLAHTGTGLEGVVAKGLDQPYRPGRRGWQKLRTRVTAEAVVGSVIGPVGAPRELTLGRHDDAGGLRQAAYGGTRRQQPTARVRVGDEEVAYQRCVAGLVS
jgi:ATP-dependent DNA ligase